MKSYFLYIAVVLLFLLGCRKKEYPIPTNSEATNFYSKLIVNGEEIDLATGKTGYYMYSSFKLDSSNVYNLLGEFRKTACSNCTNSLKIQINDSKVSVPGAPIDIATTLQTKQYQFIVGEREAGYTVAFKGSLNKAAFSYAWDFGDGITSTATNPVHDFKPGKYTVILKTTGVDKCESISVYTLSLLSQQDLNAFVSASTVSTTVTYSSHVTGGRSPYTYQWTLGDGSTSTSSVVTHTYSIKGGYGVKLTVKDADGKTTICNYNAIAGTDPSACAGNFSFSVLKYNQVRLGLSKALISFTDKNGIVYTSDNTNQPSDSGLEILSIEDFVENENKEKTKKVKMKFNCTLYNGANSVSLQGTEVQVGFAYK